MPDIVIKELSDEISTLREQVEKLTEECVVLRASNRTKLDAIAYLETREDENQQKIEKLTKERDEWKEAATLTKKILDAEEELAALAEQNEKMRKALTKWRYLDSSYNWRCGHCGNEEEDEHKEGCALALHDLASPILNRIRAEGMRMAADYIDRSYVTVKYRCDEVRARAAELEKTND